MDSIEEKYVFNTAEDSVRDKDWAAGSSQRLDSTEYVFGLRDGNFYAELITVKYPPALWKIFDEIIVNALDHVVRCGDAKNGVTYINITYEKNGWIKVTNDGPGVEICEHKVASEHFKRKVMVPEFVFGMLFQGSNKTKDPSSIIGGTNGFGAKIANTRSTKFAVETVDIVRKLGLVQVWENGMRKCHPPTIMKISEMPAEKRGSHTTIGFIPDYKSFNYGDLPTDEEYELLNRLFLTRAIYASVYACSSRKKGVAVTYNGTNIPFKNVTDVANVMFPGAEMISATLKPAELTKTTKVVKTTKTAKPPKNPIAPQIHPWEICVVIAPNSKVAEISIVDGVVVRGGKHTKYIMDLITTCAKEKVAKLFNEKEVKFSSQFISNNVFLLVNAKIPSPSWDGQRKDVLEYNTKRFSVYTLPKQTATAIATAIYDRVSAEIFNKAPASTKKKGVVDYDKYRKADLCGTKRSSECSLVVVEGDSAFNGLQTAIVMSIGYERTGIICTGGVIINARNKSEVTTRGDTQYVKKTEQLEKNKFFTAFCLIVGLSTAYKYAVGSATYAWEMAQLRYGSICICVDQDLDGKGNILGSFLSVFEYWWPNLLAAGFVKWFCSPIIRAYPKRGGKVLEFYSTGDYDQWNKTSPRGYNIVYYKGMGTHSREESISMFKKYSQLVYTYRVDDRTSRLFNIYFGNEPGLRKIELSRPSVVASAEEIAAMAKSKTISCSDHLLWETNLYQKDNLERKLDHIIDGQNQAGRKILDGIMKAFNADNDQIKVAILAGFISQRENYHHGEASLMTSITKRGFIAPGGKQLPPLRPMSNFGTRLEGGNDASQPRYIFAKENRNLNRALYPPADYQLLEFNFDEGVRGEPKYFVPIIPVAICESTEIPAHGWKIKTWARDVFVVIDNVLRMIEFGTDKGLFQMPVAKYEPAPYAWKGAVRYIRGHPHAMGVYKWINETTLHITELPLRDWTVPYLEMLKKKAQSEDGLKIFAGGDPFTCANTDWDVSIKIAIAPGGRDYLEQFEDYPYCDGVEEFFCLRANMDDHLNFMGIGNQVRSVSSYEDVLIEWFPVRAEHYRLRIDRELTLMRLQTTRLRNIIRYIRDDTLKLPTRKIAVMVEMLTKADYDRVDIRRLSSPDFMPTGELTETILRGAGSGYDYLLDLSDKAKSEERLQEYVSDLDRITAEANELENKANQGRFYGAVVWTEELARLREIIEEGFKTAWKFGDYGKYTLE